MATDLDLLYAAIESLTDAHVAIREARKSGRPLTPDQRYAIDRILRAVRSIPEVGGRRLTPGQQAEVARGILTTTELEGRSMTALEDAAIGACYEGGRR